jgi:hypothetical protein
VKVAINTAPTLASLGIVPSSPLEGAAVSCHATITDSEQPLLNYNATILKDGAAVAQQGGQAQSGEDTQVASWNGAGGVAGETLLCSISWNDGFSSTSTSMSSPTVIFSGNNPPSAAITIFPPSPVAGDTVYCRATVTDAEDSAAGYTVVVLKGASPVTSPSTGTISNNTNMQVLNWAVAGALPGESLYCDMTAQDSDGATSHASSSAAIVAGAPPQNTPPSASSFTISPSSAMPGPVAFTCNARVTDSEQYNLHYAAALYNHGVLVAQSSGQIQNNVPLDVLSYSLDAELGDAFQCVLDYDDGALPGAPAQTQTVQVSYPPSSPIGTCDQTQFNDTAMLCGIAALAMFALIALTYIGGEAMPSPRMLTWAKTESLQAVASLLMVGMVLFMLSTLCTIQVGEMQSVSGSSMPKIYKDAPGFEDGQDTLYDGAMRYVENVAALALSNIASMRYDLAAYELRMSYQTFECSGSCLLSLSSVSVSPFSGSSMSLAITNNLMGLATVSYLSAIFQYFVLIYIYGGLFLVALPLALVLRSIPFMRHLGGALFAIFVSLYIFYPLMLVADAYIAPGFVSNSLSPTAGNTGKVVMCDRDDRRCPGADIFSTGAQPSNIICSRQASPDPCLGGLEWELESVRRTRGGMDNLHPNELPRAIRLNVLIFLTSIFLPAMNFIVIAAFGRELSRFLGEEADMSRLGQMI